MVLTNLGVTYIGQDIPFKLTLFDQFGKQYTC